MTKTNFAAGQLKSIIERIERLEEEKKQITADIAEVKAEAKANGFDPKIINAVLKLRKLTSDERDEQGAMVDRYLIALGMLPEFEPEAEREMGTKETALSADDFIAAGASRIDVERKIVDFLSGTSSISLDNFQKELDESNGGISNLTDRQILTAVVTANHSVG